MKSHSLFCLQASFKYWKVAMRSPQSLFQGQLAQPFLVGSSPLIIFVAPSGSVLTAPHISCTGAPGLDVILQMGPYRGRVEGNYHLPHPAGHCSMLRIFCPLFTDCTRTSTVLQLVVSSVFLNRYMTDTFEQADKIVGVKGEGGLPQLFHQCGMSCLFYAS